MDPTTILKLRALRSDLDKIITDLEAPLKVITPAATSGYSVPVASPPPPTGVTTATSTPAAVYGGLLQNPFVGQLNQVTWKEVPTKFGPGKVFELHVDKGMKFGTFKEEHAKAAEDAILRGAAVSIVWKTRPSGKYTNYDVVSLTVPKSYIN